LLVRASFRSRPRPTLVDSCTTRQCSAINEQAFLITQRSLIHGSTAVRNSSLLWARCSPGHVQDTAPLTAAHHASNQSSQSKAHR
jgi:hypothetical protein